MQDPLVLIHARQSPRTTVPEQCRGQIMLRVHKGKCESKYRLNFATNQSNVPKSTPVSVINAWAVGVMVEECNVVVYDAHTQKADFKRFLIP